MKTPELVTYSHDAIKAEYMTDDDFWPCDQCPKDMRDHTWVTLNRAGFVVKCSNQKKHLTDSTGVG